MKHFTRFLLAMVVAFASSISTFAYVTIANNGKNIYYGNFSDYDNSCWVVSGGYGSYSGDIVIPATVRYNGKTYSVTHIEQQAFQNCTELNSVVIGDNVTDIMMNAFMNTGLTSVTLGENVRLIYSSAFGYCRNIRTVYIPKNVKDISSEAFVFCESLEAIEVDEDNGYYVSVDGVLYSKDMTLLHTCPARIGKTEFVIPDSVSEIRSGAFLGCSTLETIEVPGSVKNIGMDVFYGCSALKSIAIPEGIKHIGMSLFRDCVSLKSVSLPQSVTLINSSSFYGCTSLERITIPSTVETIGDNAFSGCTSLMEITILNPTPPSISGYNKNSVFYNVPDKCVLRVPDESVSEYKSSWRGYSNPWEYRSIYGFVFDISDGSEYTFSSNLDFNVITYTRNFASTNWQALYIPFTMKYEDWADKADVAYINNVHQWDDDNDGVIDRTMLEFITKKSGEIKANTPYVIRPKQTGEVTFTAENTTLYAAPATDGFVDCMSTTTRYVLAGTYQEKTNMYSDGCYGMVDGQFRKAESDAVTLSPFRIYLKIESRDGDGSVQNARRIGIIVDGVADKDATDINEITQGPSLKTPDCFNLAGQKVDGSYKGIIVKNGKKILVK